MQKFRTGGQHCQYRRRTEFVILVFYHSNDGRTHLPYMHHSSVLSMRQHCSRNTQSNAVSSAGQTTPACPFLYFGQICYASHPWETICQQIFNQIFLMKLQMVRIWSCIVTIISQHTLPSDMLSVLQTSLDAGNDGDSHWNFNIRTSIYGTVKCIAVLQNTEKSVPVTTSRAKCYLHHAALEFKSKLNSPFINRDQKGPATCASADMVHYFRENSGASTKQM